MREAKPAWSDVPPHVAEFAAQLLGSPVKSAEIVWGGFAPNATFAVTCDNGQRFFLKGTPPWQSTRGREIMALELAFYQTPYLPAGIAPAYYGQTEVDGWQLCALELLDKGQETLPWNETKYRAVFRSLLEIYAHNKNRTDFEPFVRGHLQHIEEINEIQNVLGSIENITKCAAIFSTPPAAASWFSTHASALRDSAQKAYEYTEYTTLLHCDLRDDNIIFDTAGKARLVDWAWPTQGPLALDVLYFVQTGAANGGLPVEKALDIFYEEGGPKFDEQGINSIMCLYAIAYAGWAPLPFQPTMPRLRTSQGFLLNALLQQAADRIGLGNAPKVNHALLQQQAAAYKGPSHG